MFNLRLRVSTLLLLFLPFTAAAHDAQSIRYFSLGDRVEVTTTGANTDVNTPFTLASVGKLMTAVAVLRYAERGALDLDAPVSGYVSKDLAQGFGGLKDVSLRQMLTMSSGLPDYLTLEFFDDALEAPKQVQRAAVALSYAFGEPRLFEPGEAYDYSNTNYVLLGLVLEAVSRSTYAEVLDRELFAPLGMDSTFVFGSRRLPASFPEGHEDGEHIRDYYSFDGFGDGGVISTAPDLARFYRALFWDRIILSAAALATLMSDPLEVDYGMGLELEGDIIGHSGGDLGFVSDVRMDLTTSAIAITLSADANAATDWAWDRLAR